MQSFEPPPMTYAVETADLDDDPAARVDEADGAIPPGSVTFDDLRGSWVNPLGRRAAIAGLILKDGGGDEHLRNFMARLSGPRHAELSVDDLPLNYEAGSGELTYIADIGGAETVLPILAFADDAMVIGHPSGPLEFLRVPNALPVQAAIAYADAYGDPAVRQRIEAIRENPGLAEPQFDGDDAVWSDWWVRRAEIARREASGSGNQIQADAAQAEYQRKLAEATQGIGSVRWAVGVNGVSNDAVDLRPAVSFPALMTDTRGSDRTQEDFRRQAIDELFVTENTGVGDGGIALRMWSLSGPRQVPQLRIGRDIRRQDAALLSGGNAAGGGSTIVFEADVVKWEGRSPLLRDLRVVRVIP